MTSSASDGFVPDDDAKATSPAATSGSDSAASLRQSRRAEPGRADASPLSHQRQNGGGSPSREEASQQTQVAPSNAEQQRGCLSRGAARAQPVDEGGGKRGAQDVAITWNALAKMEVMPSADLQRRDVHEDELLKGERSQVLCENLGSGVAVFDLSGMAGESDSSDEDSSDWSSSDDEDGEPENTQEGEVGGGSADMGNWDADAAEGEDGLMCGVAQQAELDRLPSLMSGATAKTPLTPLHVSCNSKDCTA